MLSLLSVLFSISLPHFEIVTKFLRLLCNCMILLSCNNVNIFVAYFLRNYKICSLLFAPFLVIIVHLYIKWYDYTMNQAFPTAYFFSQLKQGTYLIRVKRIFAIRFATCRIIRNPPASGSLLMICHNRMLLRSLSGVACTTPDTSKSQPTAYCFEQLKQATCLIRLKCIFMHEHNQTGMPNWFVAIAYSGKSHLTWLLSRNVYCAFCVSVLILSIHLSFSIFIPISL